MPMYIGGGGGGGASGGFPISGPYGAGGAPGGTLQGNPKLTMPFRGGPFKPPGRFAGGGGNTYSGAPASLTVPSNPNVLPAQTVRPTGPSGGFDPAYLQNLATAIGGLFSRPQGNLSFNPLGNLSDIKSPGLGVGNAPLPGLPSTMLQDALNSLAFIFNQPAAAPAGGGGSTVGGTGGGYAGGGPGRGGRPIYPE